MIYLHRPNLGALIELLFLMQFASLRNFEIYFLCFFQDLFDNMEVFDVSKSAEKEEETESVKDDLEVTNILKTNDKVICIKLFLLPCI